MPVLRCSSSCESQGDPRGLFFLLAEYRYWKGVCREQRARNKWLGQLGG